MKKFRFVPLLACAGVSAALGLSSLAVPSALAQPAAATAKKGKGQRQAKGSQRGMKVSRRVLNAIEAKSGKTLTDDQKTQLNAAQKIRMEAIEDARDKFLREAATITGLSVEDLREIEKPGKKAAGAAPKTNATP